jgi:hypothetical protein
MRELLELAIDKGVTRFLAKARRLGLFFAIPGRLTEGDLSRFQKQLEEME